MATPLDEQQKDLNKRIARAQSFMRMSLDKAVDAIPSSRTISFNSTRSLSRQGRKLYNSSQSSESSQEPEELKESREMSRAQTIPTAELEAMAPKTSPEALPDSSISTSQMQTEKKAAAEKRRMTLRSFGAGAGSSQDSTLPKIEHELNNEATKNSETKKSKQSATVKTNGTKRKRNEEGEILKKTQGTQSQDSKPKGEERNSKRRKTTR